MMYKTEVAKKVRECRVRAKLTQREMAELSGISVASLVSIESASVNFSFNTLDQICKAMNMEMQVYLLGNPRPDKKAISKMRSTKRWTDEKPQFWENWKVEKTEKSEKPKNRKVPQTEKLEKLKIEKAEEIKNRKPAEIERPEIDLEAEIENDFWERFKKGTQWYTPEEYAKYLNLDDDLARETHEAIRETENQKPQ